MGVFSRWRLPQTRLQLTAVTVISVLALNVSSSRIPQIFVSPTASTLLRSSAASHQNEMPNSGSSSFLQASLSDPNKSFNPEIDETEYNNEVNYVSNRLDGSKTRREDLEDSRFIQELVSLNCGSLPCDLIFVEEHVKKERSKRSSPTQNETFHDQGGLQGPFRVFKYINDEIPGTSLGKPELPEESSSDKVDQNSRKNVEPSSSRKKNQKSKSSKKKKSKSDPISRSRSVTDRSLIPHSYFASDQPTQNNQVALQNTFSSATTTATAITTLPESATRNSHNLNGEIVPFKNSSSLLAALANRTEGYAPQYNNSNNENAALPDDHLMEASSVSYQTYLPFNESFLSDRARRSPYKVNLPNPNPHLRNLGQFQIPQHHRLKPFPNNNQGYHQHNKNRQQQQQQAIQNANRAALYVRPGMSANRVGQPNRIPPQQQQPQFQPPMQMRPPQGMRVQPSLNPQNPNKFPQQNNFQGPIRPQQVPINNMKPPFPNNPNLNNNMKNNIKLQPPQLPVPQGGNPPQGSGGIKLQNNKEPNIVNPSSSNDHYIYRPYSDPNVEPQPTWNHPMYRRYSKAAKRFQNKVTDFFGSGSSEGKGSRKKDIRSGDHSNLPPIPLPRPRPVRRNNKDNRPRQRQNMNNNNNNNGPAIRYSYPKSAQNIQDILNHFQTDNNEIFDEMASKPGSTHHRPPKSAHSHHSHNHAQAPSYLYPPPSPAGAPMIASDLSNELKDVRFSLMRDIREFAKRPSLIPDQEDHHHDHDSSPHSSMPSLPNYVPRIKSDDPINKMSHYYSPRDSPEEEDNHSKHYPSTSTSQKRYSHAHKSPHTDEDITGNNNSLDRDGFDEMFYPKPKPVRDMIKANSKFKQQLDREEEGGYHQREREHSSTSSRKRDRPTPRPYRDSVDTSKSVSADPPSSFYHRSKGSSGKNKYLEETERSDEQQHPYGLKIPKRISSSSSRHPPSSVEEPPDQPPPPPPSSSSSRRRERDRTSSSQKYRESSDDSPIKAHPNRIWGKPLDESFHSWEDYKPTYYREKDRHEERDEDNNKSFPKSIRDKIRDTSSEYNGHTRIRDESSTIRTSVNTPLVLKRPYQPYRIPPQIFMSPDGPSDSPYMNTKHRGSPDTEFWPTFTETTERIRSSSGSGSGKRPYRNKHKPLVPSIGGLGAGPVLRPSSYGYSPSGTPLLVPAGHNGLLSSPEVEEEVLEIHTGLTPPGSPYLHEKKLQQAYLDLLHHKMQQEAGLFTNNPLVHQHQQMQMQSKSSSSSSSSSGQKKKAPMRMKIHIYPNNENEHPSDGMTGDNGSSSWSGTGNSWNIGGSSQSTMVSAPPLFNSRNPQQQFTHKMGGNRASNVPGPPYQAFTSPNAPGITSSPVLGGDKGNPNNPNKNLVLHLHVHRRNDIGPVELEAEASEHISSTINPVTYKEMFDDHEEHKDQLSNHKVEHREVKEENKSGDGDKSVSMEVPIHDDKIEDVLHTLLQYRDRSDTPESQRRKKRKSSKSSNKSKTNAETTSARPNSSETHKK